MTDWEEDEARGEMRQWEEEWNMRGRIPENESPVIFDGRVYKETDDAE